MSRDNPAINPHVGAPTSLYALFIALWREKGLILQLTQRDIASRYRGSVLGVFWALIQPMLMLCVYTFAFSVVFKARWGDTGETKVQFAIVLFVGLIVHNLFSEMINKAPGLVISNSNYVKKVVFPLEILPVVTLGSALFHTAISLGVLLAAVLLSMASVPWTIIFLPLVLLPFILLLLGVSWALASLGVYLRDLSQITGVLTTVLMFLSPVFYPISAVPENLRPIILANPLTFIIEQCRGVLLFGQMPDWGGLGLYYIVALLCMWLGFVWFQKTRKGFADVL